MYDFHFTLSKWSYPFVGKADCTHKRHLFISTKCHVVSLRGVSGGSFVLINK